MPQRFFSCAAGIGGKAGVLFQLPQCDHSTDGKTVLGLLYGVQSQTGQVDGCADIDVLHFEPDHAAQHTVGLFLVQLPRFFQSFGPLIFSDRHHSCRFLSFFLCSFILTQISI